MVNIYLRPVVFSWLLLAPVFLSATEIELTTGINIYSQKINPDNPEISDLATSGMAPLLGIKIRAPHGIKQQHLLGTGLDVTEVDGKRLLGFRAIDYQWESQKSYRIGTFIGAANLDNDAPQIGYYLGLNFSQPKLYKNLGYSIEATAAYGLGRDRLPTDPAGKLPDIFFNIYSVSANLTWIF